MGRKDGTVGEGARNDGGEGAPPLSDDVEVLAL